MVAETVPNPVEETIPPVPPVEETRTDSQPDAAPATPAPEDSGPNYETPEDYLAAKEAERKEGAAKAPESPRYTGPDPQEVARRRALLNQNFQSRQASLDAHEQALIDDGVSPVTARHLVKEAKDRLNEEHADSLAHAGYAASAETEERISSELLGSISADLTIIGPTAIKQFNERLAAITKPGPDGVGRAGFQELLQAYAETKYRGWASPEDQKQNTLKDYAAGLKQGERNRASGRSQSTVDGAGTRSPSGPLTADKAETLPITELQKIRAQQRAG